jgi:DNA-directed RNA polymerase subunit K/omega/uncharacterized protein (DUF697 family)
MVQKRSQFDSSEVIQRADELMNASSNRYRITVQIANRAKRYRHDDFEYNDPMMKPVIRAIMEMSDELTQPEIIGEFIEPSPTIESLKSKREFERKSPPPSSNSQSSPSSSKSSFTPPPTNTTPLPEPSEQILQINAEVNANPQLRQLRQESDLKAWNCLVDWIAESACDIQFAACEASVKRLQYSYQGKSPREIARVLIVQKSLQAAGVNLLRGIPGAEAVISGLANYDLPEITKLSAEMVYQIADIYGFNLQAPERKVEAITAFGAAFLGEKAIDAGIDWLEYGVIPSKIISASAKALMIYAVGNAACLFYEAKLNAKANPLTSPRVLNEIREESQHYLDDATSEEAIVNIISGEINTALTIDYSRLRNLLKAKDWKKADQETRDIVVKIANRDFAGNLTTLPREDLRTINQLWLDNSNGHFGFSVQKRIYLDLSKKVGDFGEKVGWRTEAGMFGGIFAWKSYGWLTFNLNNAPKGHLPAFPLDMPWWYHKGETTKDFAQSILERNDW